MRFPPLRPATWHLDGQGRPCSTLHGDVYHPAAGALRQAQRVFLQGNGLPQRWQGQSRCVVLETGFGLGHNFLATWQAWRDDPQRCDRLCFVSIEAHPLTRADAALLHQAHRGTPLEPLVQALLDQWPLATPDLHLLGFESGRVQLLVAHAPVAVALKELDLQADAFFLDGFSPDRNPDMWTPEVMKGLARLAAPGATLATWSVARRVHEHLSTAGFAVRKVSGFAHKEHITVGRFQPWPGQRLAPARPALWTPGEEPVAVVGAGLAGAAVARSLGRRGVPCTVWDAAPRVAAGASGNPAGLFHGVWHAEDGAHARWSRAASHVAHAEYAPAVRSGRLPGQVEGLWRLEQRLTLERMQALLAQGLWSPDYVQAQALPDGHAAWHFPTGGWVDPSAWVEAALATRSATVHTGVALGPLQRDDDGHWRLHDAAGRVRGRSRVVVLAAAQHSIALCPLAEAGGWPLGSQRGQISGVAHGTAGLVPPPGPISGGGYALNDARGWVWCGASAHRHDPEAALRETDHHDNLQKLSRLTGSHWPAAAPPVHGRVGWRFHSADRLPVLGPWGPAPGLLWATGLASRGITWAPLMGECIAAWVTGDPLPLPRSLAKALGPGRWRPGNEINS